MRDIDPGEPTASSVQAHIDGFKADPTRTAMVEEARAERLASEAASAEPTSEVVQDRQDPDAWRVETIDYAGDGACCSTLFMGARARERAEAYAALAHPGARKNEDEVLAIVRAAFPYAPPGDWLKAVRALAAHPGARAAQTAEGAEGFRETVNVGGFEYDVDALKVVAQGRPTEWVAFDSLRFSFIPDVDLTGNAPIIVGPDGQVYDGNKRLSRLRYRGASGAFVARVSAAELRAAQTPSEDGR